MIDSYKRNLYIVIRLFDLLITSLHRMLVFYNSQGVSLKLNIDISFVRNLENRDVYWYLICCDLL